LRSTLHFLEAQSLLKDDEEKKKKESTTLKDDGGGVPLRAVVEERIKIWTSETKEREQINLVLGPAPP